MLRSIVLRSKAAVFGVLLASAMASSAHAATISGVINTSNIFSPTNQSSDGTSYFNTPATAPFSSVIVGEFDFTIPSGESIFSATITGNFGSNTLGSGSSQVDLFLNGVAVAHCDALCETNSLSSDVPWTYTFTSAQFASLSSGAAVLTALQTSVSQIVLDPTSVTIQTAPVPVPGAIWLLGSGLVSLFGFARSKFIVA